ncbi:MAG: hypothetical protein ACRD5F_09915 [Candidatus Acidiferrales bacterium]
MRCRWTIVALTLLLVSLPAAADDWKVRNFNATADQCYRAAERALAKRHEVTFKDARLRVIRYTVGVTSLSWGYRMALHVEPAEDSSGNASACRATHTVEVKGGPLLSWGRGKKEVRQTYARMEEELAAMFTAERKAGREGPSNR